MENKKQSMEGNIKSVKRWLRNLKVNQVVRRKGKTYPFFYLHIDKDNFQNRKVGKCLTSGQVSWQPVEFSKSELKAKDWILITDKQGGSFFSSQP
jgi:hypothetical protein